MKHHSVQKRIEFFQDYTLKEDDESALLQTIRVPRNLLFLSDKLPQPNYEPVEPNAKSYGDKGGNDLPSIVVKKKPNPEHSIDKILEKREKARLNAAKPSVRKGRSQDVPPSRRVVKRDDKKTERSYEKNRVDRSYEKRRIERSYEKKRVERSYEPVLHGMKKYLPRGLKVMPSSHRVYEPGYYSPYLKNKKIYQKYRNEAKINLRSIKNAMEIRPVKSRERKEQKRIIANRRLSPIKKKNRL